MNVIDEKTTRTFEEWNNGIEQIEKLEKDLNSTKIKLSNSKTKLGQCLCPKNAKIGEIFSIWIDGKFLNIEILSNVEYKIWWRY